MSHGNSPVNRRLRVAVIGCGQIAGGYDEQAGAAEVRTHAKAYRSNKATDLVAVVDRDLQRARGFSARWGNPAVYTDVRRMLASEQPDLVSICTPDGTHAAVLETCLDCPSLKAVWCEKPLTTDVQKAEAMVSAYKSRGIALAVNYQRRWHPEIERLKEALHRGELGAIQKVVVYYSKGICHNGSHAIDLLLDWFGQPVAARVHGSHVDYVPDDPTVDARLLFGNVPAYLIGVDERAYSLFEIHVLGTTGRVNVIASGCEVEWYRARPDPLFSGHRDLCPDERWVQGETDRAMVDALDEIVESIFTGGPVRSSGESALATLRVCQQLARQALAALGESGVEASHPNGSDDRSCRGEGAGGVRMAPGTESGSGTREHGGAAA